MLAFPSRLEERRMEGKQKKIYERFNQAMEGAGMKRFILICIIGCILGQVSNVGADSILMPDVHKQAQLVASAWYKGQEAKLNQAVMDLMTAEARLLAVGASDLARNSYLSRVPQSIQDRDACIGAYVWLLHRERDNRPLWPTLFFAGKQFSFQYSPGQ